MFSSFYQKKEKKRKSRRKRAEDKGRISSATNAFGIEELLQQKPVEMKESGYFGAKCAMSVTKLHTGLHRYSIVWWNPSRAKCTWQI